MVEEIFRHPGTALLARIRSRELSASEVTGACLDRIDAVEPRLMAFRRVFREEALRRAGSIDDAFATGADPGPLAGLPVAVKDIICVARTPTTCGSRILQHFVPIFHATVIRKPPD